MKFETGDKVRVTKVDFPSFKHHVGHIGTVLNNYVDTSDGRTMYTLDINSLSGINFYEDELELVERNMKYTKGDVVRINNAVYSAYIGQTGTIHSHYRKDEGREQHYNVRMFESEDLIAFAESQLELMCSHEKFDASAAQTVRQLHDWLKR